LKAINYQVVIKMNEFIIVAERNFVEEEFRCGCIVAEYCASVFLEEVGCLVDVGARGRRIGKGYEV
jgi:hypothetical protein